MKFKELFVNCKNQLKEEIKNVWFEDKELWEDNGTLKSPVYENQLDRLLDKCFTGGNILVEDMGEWEGAEAFPVDLMQRNYWREWPAEINGNKLNKEDVSRENYSKLGLIDKPYEPFKHQVECWRKLLEEKKSICVTTGTGSGKTECFMVPLVKDLADNYVQRHAANPNLNGEPVQAIFLYPLNALMDDQRTRMSECIECSEQPLTFAVYNGNTPKDINDTEGDVVAVEENRKKHELVRRDEIRLAHHPNILFTNPTMLEYLLLRSDDRDILKHSQGQLRWIVIDETHTYTGAGAAELALLIRRVLDAFGTNVNDVRFATSSATVGGVNGEKDLKKFIADITGKPENQIEIVTGCRSLQNAWGRDFIELHDNSFLTLDEMIPGDKSVEEKLEAIDRLCEKDENDRGLRVKLHFFAKALNRGLYIDMNKTTEHFVLEDEIPLDPNTGHYDDRILEAKYCEHCGTVFASGILKDNRLSKAIVETTSIFDNTDSDEDDHEDTELDSESDNTYDNSSMNESDETDVLIAQFSEDKVFSPDAIRININNDMVSSEDDAGRFIYYPNPDKCPVCGEEIRPNKRSPIRSFRIATDQLARILAPKLLEQAEPDNTPGLLAEGKQMISFADSRAKAAKPSLKQNKEMESKWVEWVVFNRLQREMADTTKIQDLEEDLKKEQDRYQRDRQQRHLDNINSIETEIANAKNHSITWMTAIDELMNNTYFNYFAKQFAQNGDLDDDGECTEPYKMKYALAAMYEVFKMRHKKKLCAETRGQIKIVYPIIEQLRSCNLDDVLPYDVKELNKVIPEEDKRISLNDWCDLLTLFLDHRVRKNQCLFFEEMTNGWHDVDITACRNLRTQNGVRRTAKKYTNKSNTPNLFQELLGKLIGRSYSDLSETNKNLVNSVVDCCWDTLRNDSFSLIETGRFMDDRQQWQVDSIEGGDEHKQLEGRMNLTKMSFKLPEEGTVKKCPITNRYIATYFKDFSPYKDETHPYGTHLEDVDPSQLPQMVKPMLFIQSEHTAQLGRKQTKERIKDFKNHKINILACSTTMEMGVDLGSVELVEMTNIPPHPANYKQRAGRAGRRGQNRSACVTICGSDGVDARFFNKSKTNVTKTINPPIVEINSPQVVQRHINSFLFLKWSGTVGLNDEVKDLFTNYHWKKDVNEHEDKTVAYFNENNVDVEIRPNGQYGCKPYETEHNINALWSDFVSYLQNRALDDQDVKDGISNLTRGTILSGVPLAELINNTQNSITAIWNELDNYFLSLKENQRLAEEYVARIENNKNNNDGVEEKDTINKIRAKLDKRKKALNYDFTSRLRDNLLKYLSTHQFLPNANMPVNIIELKISDAREMYSHNIENPTYDLATALGQWAPGNYVTIKDTTYQIGGVERDYGKSWDTIKKCTCGHTWISQENTCPNCGQQELIKWPVNGKRELKLYRPVAFIPTTDRSRITDNSKNYSIAKAELIGASKIHHPLKGWIAHRTSDSVGEISQILIYNDGNKFGYRICSKCGKTQLESRPAPYDGSNEIEVLRTFYDKASRNNPNLLYHKDLPGSKEPCFCDLDRSQNNNLYRNMIIGGLIQTDYCEMRFYRRDNFVLSPFNSDDDKKILTTLGILFCAFMVDKGICERGDIDFIVMGKDRLCIYDKAKGGAGYSKQLKQALIEEALEYCVGRLTNCNLFQLLDTYTQRHAENIDINRTLEWLISEREHRNDIPQNISDVYPNSTVSSFVEIEQTIKR